MIEGMNHEPLADMLARLGDSGSAAQVRALLKGIQFINEAPGCLDENNAAAGLYWVAVALVGEEWAANALRRAAADEYW